MSWQVQQGINFGHSDRFGAIRDFYDVVACTNFSFLQHAKVKSWSVLGYEQRGHSRLVHADADAVTRHARLCHFENSITNAVSITDANLVIGKSFNREVLSELAKTKITTAQKVFPVTI